MSRFNTPLNVSNVESWEDLRRYSSQILSGIIDTINGRLDFLSNNQVKQGEVVFPSANADVTFDHKLGFKPNGYLVVGKDTAFMVYDGSKASTVDTIYLRASAAGTAQILVY